jgi:hypothetical protein
MTRLKNLLVSKLPTEGLREIEQQIVKIYEECYYSSDVTIKTRAAACISINRS